MESQLDLNQERKILRDRFVELLPEISEAELDVNGVAYADGALSAKHKRMVALGIALGRGCTNCVLGQTERALEAGATKEEILEVLGVAVAIGGTMGMAESLQVIRMLEELGKL